LALSWMPSVACRIFCVAFSMASTVAPSSPAARAMRRSLRSPKSAARSSLLRAIVSCTRASSRSSAWTVASITSSRLSASTRSLLYSSIASRGAAASSSGAATRRSANICSTGKILRCMPTSPLLNRVLVSQRRLTRRCEWECAQYLPPGLDRGLGIRIPGKVHAPREKQRGVYHARLYFTQNKR
jgi:hypothetical protein